MRELAAIEALKSEKGEKEVRGIFTRLGHPNGLTCDCSESFNN